MIEGKYKVSSWTLDITENGNTINAVYYKNESDSAKGTLSCELKDELYVGTFKDPDGLEGVMHLVFNETGFDGKWGAGLNNTSPKGKWLGVRLDSEDSTVNKSTKEGLDVNSLSQDELRILKLLKANKNLSEKFNVARKELQKMVDDPDSDYYCDDDQDSKDYVLADMDEYTSRNTIYMSDDMLWGIISKLPVNNLLEKITSFNDILIEHSSGLDLGIEIDSSTLTNIDNGVIVNLVEFVEAGNDIELRNYKLTENKTMKVKVIQEELFKVTVSKTIVVDVPEGTKDVKAYLEEYIKGDDAEEVFVESDNRAEVFSDVQETYYQMKSEEGEYTALDSY